MKLRRNSFGRVLRGCSYFDGTGSLRVTFSGWDWPVDRDFSSGFRFVVRSQK